jgi:hypothetical protein
VGILVADEVKTLMRKVDDLEEWLRLQGAIGAPGKGPSSQAMVEQQLFQLEESEDKVDNQQGEQDKREGEDQEDEIEEVEPVLPASKPVQLVPLPMKPVEKWLPKSAKMIIGREQVSSAFVGNRSQLSILFEGCLHALRQAQESLWQCLPIFSTQVKNFMSAMPLCQTVLLVLGCYRGCCVKEVGERQGEGIAASRGVFNTRPQTSSLAQEAGVRQSQHGF